jgi:hypothetical protein
MPRKKKAEAPAMTATEAMLRAQEGQAATLEPTKLESGAGELSEADRLAIMGSVAEEIEVAAETAPGYAERLAALSAHDGEEPGSAALAEIGGRMLGLEGRMTTLEKAMEQWASMMNGQIRQSVTAATAASIPTPAVRPASPQEEAAYCKANFEARGRGETPHDGIQAWRDAGSPGL